MLEVEIKACLGDVTMQELKAAAQRQGFVFDKTLHEVDIYFNGNNRDFLKTDEALRLRCYENLTAGTEETVVTYKGPKLDAVSNTRLEYETQIGDLTVMSNLLAALEYRPAFTVEKTREEWALYEEGAPCVTLCLDDVKNLGRYLELETLVEKEEEKEAAVEELLTLLDGFEIGRENLTRKSYLELLYFAKR